MLCVVVCCVLCVVCYVCVCVWRVCVWQVEVEGEEEVEVEGSWITGVTDW